MQTNSPLALRDWQVRHNSINPLPEIRLVSPLDKTLWARSRDRAKCLSSFRHSKSIYLHFVHSFSLAIHNINNNLPSFVFAQVVFFDMVWFRDGRWILVRRLLRHRTRSTKELLMLIDVNQTWWQRVSRLIDWLNHLHGGSSGMPVVPMRESPTI